MGLKDVDKRGETIFNQLNAGERGDLKWFITGQIQNILANEHGIGGTKGVREQVRQRADDRIDALLNSDAFLEKLAERLVNTRRLSIDKIMTKAVEDECKRLVAAKVQAAIDPIRINVAIAREIPEDAPKGFAQF